VREVGIHELKNKLSLYLRLVGAGESVLVTDRGRVIAELRPPGAESQSETVDPVAGELADLASCGRAVVGAPHDPELYRPRPAVIGAGTPAALLHAERGTR
jgi:antitoxin (DNA-binding transcriptional repressor) of toxin-antitoxin stability system